MTQKARSCTYLVTGAVTGYINIRFESGISGMRAIPSPLHFPIARAAEKANGDAHWRYHELATGHMPMWTAPGELVDLLLKLT